MNRFSKLFVVVALSLMVSLTLGASAAFAQDPDNGKVVWEEELGCKQCHGDAGEGKWAGPIAGHGEHGVEEWIEQIRTPRRAMPSFTAEQVSDETIMDIYAYLTALPEPEGEFSPVDAGLAEDASAGQQLIAQKRCIACHTETGPVGGFINRGELPTVEAVMTQVRTPRKAMPAYSTEQVSDEELASITEFLVAQVEPQLGATEETATEETATEETATEETATEETTTEETATEEMATEEAAPEETTTEMPESGQTGSSLSILLTFLFGVVLAVTGLVFRKRHTTI